MFHQNVKNCDVELTQVIHLYYQAKCNFWEQEKHRRRKVANTYTKQRIFRTRDQQYMQLKRQSTKELDISIDIYQNQT